jgi:hypothetical protein
MAKETAGLIDDGRGYYRKGDFCVKVLKPEMYLNNIL